LVGANVLNKDAETGGEWRVAAKDGGGDKADLEMWAPPSVREARLARERRDDAWRYVWMNFASMIILMVTLAIVCYQMGAQSCRLGE
jgi:hypothetical protein